MTTPPASSPHCPRCGRPLPGNTPLGVCPTCLLEAGLPSEPAAGTPTPPSPAELSPEFPELEILELLGRGGMGAVYKARQKSLDRLVALKILRPGLDADPNFAGRFTREARSLALLNHPGIVTLYEFGRTPGGQFFILMEFVDGVNLRQLLAGGRLSPREALAIVPPLCDALQYAHDRGLVHRDIKPENILIDRLGRVKIADFGLAKLTTQMESATATPSPGAAAADLTEAGKVMGTPRYMAPEQRERPTEVDHRADIYALGVVLYQMLTGEIPDAKQLRPPSHRVQLDVRLDAIVLRALEANPALRYAAVSEFKTQIETVVAESPPPPPPAPPAPAAAPAPNGAPPESGVPAQIKAPAIAMMIVGIIDLVGLLFGLLIGGVALIALPMIGGLSGIHFGFNPGNPIVPLVGMMAGLAIMLVIGWLLLHLVSSIYVIAAARRMQALRRHRSACTGAVLLIVLGAMGLFFSTSSPGHFFTALWSLVELGVGIWSLVVLRRPEVKTAFDQPSTAGLRTTPPSAAAAQTPGLIPPASQVATPATGLMVASAIHFLLGGVVIPLLVFTRAFHGNMPGSPAPIPVFAILLAVMMLVAAPSILTFIAAWRMRRLRGHGLAVAGAILAIVTFQGMGLGLVFGIWSLVVLTRREVQAAFAQSAPRSRAGGCLLAAGVVAGCLLLAIAISVVGLFFAKSQRVSLSSSADFHATSTPRPSVRAPVETNDDLGPLPEGVLDLSSFWTWHFEADVPVEKRFGLRELRGRHEWDGLPFVIGGQLALAGEKMNTRSDGSALPAEIHIPVGRAFDELHLLHAVLWQDPVGVEVATLRFVYADGLVREQPLRYGVHVIDWQRLPGEEVEPLSDPASKIVWRGPGSPNYNATARVIATTFANPRPDQIVDHLEFVSRRTQSSYSLVAATLAKADPNRASTAPVPPADGQRRFSGEVRIRVVDARTREPLAGAFIEPSGTFAGAGLITQPLFTDAAGVARLRYDSATTSQLSFSANWGSFAGKGVDWRSSNDIPEEIVCTVARKGRPGTSGWPAMPAPDDVAAGSAPLDHLKLSAAIALQHEMLARLAVEWLDRNGRPNPAHDANVAGLLRVCTELARRGACPGFVAPLNAPNLPPAPADEPRPWREVATTDLEDELAMDLHRLGQRQLSGLHPDETDLNLVRQTTLAAAELIARSDWHPVKGASAARPATNASPEARHRDLATRLAAASTITNWTTRDEALSSLAAEAARAGETTLTKDTLNAMTGWSARDQATRDAALALNTLGLRADAVEIAGTITNWKNRDHTLKELSQ